MKSGFFIFFVLVFLHQAYAIELNLGECQATAKNYILRGSADGSHPGARLWNFKKFSKTFADHEGSGCEKQAFNQALQEANEYWKHIEKKYECPKVGIEQCELVESNLAYIDLMEKLYDGSKVMVGNKVDNNCPIVVDHKSKKLSKEVSQIIEHLPGVNGPVDECAHLPVKDRRGAYDHLSSTSVVSSAIGGCMVNVIKGFFNNIKDLFTGFWDVMKMAKNLTQRFGGLIIDFLKAAWYGTTATFFAEQSAQGARFFNDLMNSLKAIPQALYNAAATQVKDFQCMNGVAQTEIICKAAGYLAPEVLVIALSGGFGEVPKLASISSKALGLLKNSGKVGDLFRISGSEGKLGKAGKVTSKLEDVTKASDSASGFRKTLNDLGYKIDFETPTEYFTPGKEYGKDDLVKYLKKMGATNDQVNDPKKLRRFCVGKASRMHPDRFHSLNNPGISAHFEMEFKHLMSICEAIAH